MNASSPSTTYPLPLSSFWLEATEFALQITATVGSRLLADFGQAQPSEKADGSLVTASDEWADQAFQEAIAAAFPEHGYLSEESNHIFPEKEWCWVVDPLDGTTNFARGIPIWGSSLALFHHGLPVFGCVHLPPIRQTFYGYCPHFPGDPPAAAFLTRHDRDPACPRQISPSTAPPGPNQLFNFCSRSSHWISPQFPCKARMLGGAAYNMLSVACGTLLGAVERSPKIWDVAAVWVIVQGAGAIWEPLGPGDPDPGRPLSSGQDYGRLTYPTLLSAQAEWIPLFRSFIGLQ
ncbi:MAG: inositol monophosphatase family protein [Thermostichus sp. DG_1_6_bins_120]